MSEYRLTEKQVESLNLIPVTWQDIRKTGVDMIYIRAHGGSPTYGPYRVKDPTKCVVCKLDGTEPRHYPRDKGLFISQFMRRGYSQSSVKSVRSDGEILAELLEYILANMEAQQKAILELMVYLQQRLK